MLAELEDHFNQSRERLSRIDFSLASSTAIKIARPFSEVLSEVRDTVRYLRGFADVIDGYRNFTIGHWDPNMWRLPNPPELAPPPMPGWLDIKRVVAKTARLHELIANELAGNPASVIPHYQQAFANIFLAFWDLQPEDVLKDTIFESRSFRIKEFESEVKTFRDSLAKTLTE
jgi:hypothetical protein